MKPSACDADLVHRCTQRHGTSRFSLHSDDVRNRAVISCADNDRRFRWIVAGSSKSLSVLPQVRLRPQPRRPRCLRRDHSQIYRRTMHRRRSMPSPATRMSRAPGSNRCAGMVGIVAGITIRAGAGTGRAGVGAVVTGAGIRTGGGGSIAAGIGVVVTGELTARRGVPKRVVARVSKPATRRVSRGGICRGRCGCSRPGICGRRCASGQGPSAAADSCRRRGDGIRRRIRPSPRSERLARVARPASSARRGRNTPSTPPSTTERQLTILSWPVPVAAQMRTPLCR